MASTVPVSARVRETLNNRPGSRARPYAAASAHTAPPQAMAITHSGTWPSCSSAPSRYAPSTQCMARRRLAMRSITAAGLMAKHGERTQATLTVHLPLVQVDAPARQVQAKALAIGGGFDYPAGQLREALFGIQSGQRVKFKHALRAAAGGVFLDQQRGAARIGLPGHLARRVAVAEGAQRRPLIGLARGARRRAAAGASGQRPGSPARGSWIDDDFMAQVQPGPGAKQ